MRIKFDSSHNAIQPVFVLTTRSGRQLGAIPANNIDFKNKLNSYKELSFTVYKYDNNIKNDIWDKVDNFKLCYCPDWNMYFQMQVEINENDCTEKDVTCISLGETELSQILIFNTEINTENDILSDDYKPTVLWNEDYPGASLLHRIMEKAPHYKIKHVDSSIKSIQRTFAFNDISIYDAFQEIAEEIGCLFVIETKKTADKDVERTVWVYDLESVCAKCGYRGEFISTCSNCGSQNIISGYGKDTTIFCSVDNLAEDIRYTTDTDNMKNCFKLEAGDDLMTATVINCNPTGTAYMYYFNPETKEDMSDDLSSALDEYTKKTEYYQLRHKFNLDSAIVSKYNALIDKYHSMNDELEKINSPIVGYPSLMNAVYSTINLNLYLNSGMMPKVDLPETSAENEVKTLNAVNGTSISVMDKATATETTVTSAALSYARVVVDNRYKVTVKEGKYSNGKWVGSFKVECYLDEEDSAKSNSISLTVNDDRQSFVEQKVDNVLNKAEDESSGITALFKLDDNRFKAELKKYCLVSLTTFYESCQACIDILIEQGVGDPSLWEGKAPNLYEIMYLSYLKKLSYIQAEIQAREDEIAVVEGKYNSDGKLEQDGMQTVLEKEQGKVQAELDFKSIIGESLWEEFCSYRRESVYKNDNYISDGLSDTELFKRALEFLENAKKEIYKSAMLQHTISTTLKNLLVMKEFSPLIDCFEVGNWLRIRVDDKVYKLRLIEYEINFDDLDHINVDFSDVINTADGITDLDSILKQAVSISSSFNTVVKQADDGDKSFKQLNDWVDKGLNVTNQKIVSSADNQTQVWDRHGMLFREYDEFSDTYSDIQLKIINSTMVITDDNWQTVKTAVGRYYFYDPRDNFRLKTAYGIIGETIVGKVILGEQLGIFTSNGSMSFTEEDGLVVTNGVNDFSVNPNSDSIMTISHNGEDLLKFDEKGQLYISGDGAALDINANDSITGLHSRITQTAEEIKLEVSDKDENLRSLISQTATEIRTEVQNADDGLYSEISQKVGEIRTEVNNIAEGLSSRIDQTDSSITAEVKRATESEGELSASLKLTADALTSEITRATESEDVLSSSIKQTADNVLIEAKRLDAEERKYADAQIKVQSDRIDSQVTKVSGLEKGLETAQSDISQQADKIELLVTKTDSQGTAFTSFVQSYNSFKSNVVTIDTSGNFIGTQIEQNSEHVRLSWNKCSNYIQFESGEMNIYNNSSTHNSNTLLAKFNSYGVTYYGTDNNKLVRFDRDGENFYYNNQLLGKIGINQLNGNSTTKGLVFDLDYQADADGDDYMGWAAKDAKNATSYTIKLAYYRKLGSTSDFLRAECPFEFLSKVQFDSDVTFSKGISANNITGYIQRSQLANNCIDTSELVDGAVTKDKIADGVITPSHIDSSTVYPSFYLTVVSESGTTWALQFKNGLLTSAKVIS